jgi:hypothetical protein
MMETGSIKSLHDFIQLFFQDELKEMKTLVDATTFSIEAM